MQEPALSTALAAVVPIVTADSGGGGFKGPSLGDFFPGALLFAGTPFELNRIMAIRILVVIALLLILGLGTRRMAVVPGRGQVALEFVLGFVRNNIVIGTLGEKEGKRFMPVIMAIFFFVLGMNLTSTIPGLQIAGSSLIGIPLILAVVTYLLFIYAGIHRHGVRFFKNALFLPGVPWPVYFLLVPLELFSTFILRPITLTLRLLMNMVAGHLLLVLAFSATQFLFFTVLAQGNPIGLLGVGTFAFGVAFTALELFVAALQAYVFAILTAIYIQMSIEESH